MQLLSTAAERNKGDGATRWPRFRASQSRRKGAVRCSGCLGLQGRGAALEEWLCLPSEVTLMLFVCQLLINCGQIFFSCVLSTQRPSVLYHEHLLGPESSCLKGAEASQFFPAELGIRPGTCAHLAATSTELYPA